MTVRRSDAAEERERLPHDLVHVVVLVRREAAHEVDAGRRIGERLVTLVKLPVLGARHRVVRVAFRARELVDDRRLRMLLAGQVLELGHARVGVLVRVVDDRRLLVHRRVVGLEAELERAVRQLPVPIPEELVDGAGVDHLREWHEVLDLAVVRLEHHLDVRLVKDALEHPRVPVQRHRLVRVREVAVVAVRARRHARGYGSVELRGVEVPLLARVVAEELLVELATDGADDDVL